MAAVSWPKLQTLNLSRNRFDGAGFWALSKACLPMLAELIMQYTQGRHGLSKALASADWPKLMHLNLVVMPFAMEDVWRPLSLADGP